MSLPLFDWPLSVSVGVVGAMTTGLCALAAWAGRAGGARIGPWAMRAAGLVLILLGMRVLLTHLLGDA